MGDFLGSQEGQGVLLDDLLPSRRSRNERLTESESSVDSSRAFQVGPALPEITLPSRPWSGAGGVGIPWKADGEFGRCWAGTKHLEKKVAVLGSYSSVGGKQS